MNIKKLVSVASALTIAASAFAGLATTASAAGITTTTLKPNAGWCAGASSSGVTAQSFTKEADAIKGMGFFNNVTTWKCQGVALLQFTIPKLETANTQIQKATLTSSTYTNNGNSRTYDIYVMPTEPDASSYTLTSIDDSTTVVATLGLTTTVATGLTTYLNSYSSQTTDVTEQVQAKANTDSSATITFAYTNIAKNGFLDATNSTLTIETLEVSADTHSITTVETDSATVSTDVTQADTGTEITVTPTAKAGYAAPFTISVTDSEGNEVTVNSDNTFTMPASDVTVSATAEALPTYNYTVSSNVGDYSVSGSGYAGDSVTVTYPRYILDDGAAYLKAAISNQYNYTFTLTSDNQTETLEYTKSTADTATAVYYQEGETALTENNVSNANIRCSMGKGGDVSEKTTVTTLPAGKYTITTAVWGGGKAESNQDTYTFTAGDAKVLEITTTGSWLTTTSDEFELSADTAISVEKTVDGTSSACIDFILIEKTGEYVAPEPETPDFAIDLGEAIEANGTGDYAEDVATAYIATVTNSGAEGTTSQLSVTAKEKTVSQEVKLTLEKDASVYIGMILNNVSGSDTVTAAIE